MKIGALALVGCLLLGGCASQNLVTVGQPHVYGDDVVRKLLSRRRAQLRELAGTIQAARVNEIFGVRQAVRYDLKVKARTRINEIGEEEGDPSSVSDRPALTLPEATVVPADLGRTFESSYRDLIQRDEYVTGYELQYLGDAGYLDKANKVALLRFDVSVNRYVHQGSSPKFAVAVFRLYAFDGAGGDMTSKLRVFSLSPEYSALVAQESLASLTVEDYEAQIAGRSGNTDLSGAGRFQRQLEERFATLTEVPLQFSSHRSDNSFAFAFGPRRKITKRSWFNPRRWFGHTYSLEYEIVPGTRRCWALVVLPKAVTRLRARVDYRDDTLFEPSKGGGLLGAGILPVPGRQGPVAFSEASGFIFSVGFSAADTKMLDDRAPRETAAVANTTALTRSVRASSFFGSFQARVFPDVAIPGTVTPARLKVVPWSNRANAPTYLVYPSAESSLVLNTNPEIASDEAEVFIGPVRIPSTDIEVLGRHMLGVKVKASAALENMRKSKQTVLRGQVVQPGVDPHYFTAELRSAAKASSASTSILPVFARHGEHLVLTTNEFDLSKPFQVRFGALSALARATSKTTVVITVPQAAAGPPPTPPLGSTVQLDFIGTDTKGKAKTKTFTFLYR